MSIKKLLLWEKWRPKSIEDVILLPRIKEQFKNGVTQHYIFHIIRIVVGVFLNQLNRIFKKEFINFFFNTF